MSDSSTTPRTSGLARASLLCGIGGLLIPVLIPSILAIIFGVKASKQIKASGDQLKGGDMALGGIISGIIGIIIIVLFFIVFQMLTNQPPPEIPVQ